MKNLTIRLKITLWFAVALILMVFLTYIAIISVSNQVIQKTIRDNLIETVEHNVKKIQYRHSIDSSDLSADADDFIAYGDGFLGVEDDFLDEVNQIYTALYDSKANLLYGENPIARESNSKELSDYKLQKIKVGGTVYYIFSRALQEKGLEGLWLRGVVSETQGKEELTVISRLSLILLPLLVFFAIMGGYLIAKRALKPIKKISEAAEQISRGGDLKKRIELGEGADELHQLADSFNGMFERLDKAFEAERRFTSDVSHELRTPVSVIAAQCEFSLEEDRSPEEYREALHTIRRQERRMSRLVKDMLDFTRLELRADSYPKSLVNMTELVTSVCSDMALINENGIALSYEAESGVYFIGNYQLLSRLLINLITNAYRYGKTNGHIFIVLKSPEKEIRLAVSDDGMGIAKDQQEKIFKRFYQVDDSRTRGGTGLGLSMVKEIAQLHGGHMLVDSQLGKGSTFTLVLPNKKTP